MRWEERIESSEPSVVYSSSILYSLHSFYCSLSNFPCPLRFSIAMPAVFYFPTSFLLRFWAAVLMLALSLDSGKNRALPTTFCRDPRHWLIRREFGRRRAAGYESTKLGWKPPSISLRLATRFVTTHVHPTEIWSVGIRSTPPSPVWSSSVSYLCTVDQHPATNKKGWLERANCKQKRAVSKLLTHPAFL